MAEASGVQFSTVATGLAAVVLITSVSYQPARWLFEPVGNDPAHPAIRNSAIGPVFIWCWCWPLAFARFDSGKDEGRDSRAALRLTWALGCVLLLLHIAVAFHLGHGWSHAAAWEQTRQVGGYGDGIFVNYAFALVWAVDAIWLVFAAPSYSARPRWLKLGIHGFLAFVVFNAALVFGGWRIRAICAGTFLFVLLLFPGARRLAVKGVSEAPSAE